MCLAIPAEVIEIADNDLALVEIGGARKRVSVQLVDGVSAGDFVLVHAGFAIDKIDRAEAQKTMELFEELARLVEADEIP